MAKNEAQTVRYYHYEAVYLQQNLYHELYFNYELHSCFNRLLLN